MWNVLGLASGLLATLLGERAEEVRLGMLVVGGVERGEWDRVGVEVNRAVGGRVGKDEAVEVGFTELPFKDGERDEEGVASCAESESSNSSGLGNRLRLTRSNFRYFVGLGFWSGSDDGRNQAREFVEEGTRIIVPQEQEVGPTSF